MTLPPPKLMTRSHCSRRAKATPVRTVSSVGSPATEKVTAVTPLFVNTVNNGPALGVFAGDDQPAPAKFPGDWACFLEFTHAEDDPGGRGEFKRVHVVKPEQGFKPEGILRCNAVRPSSRNGITPFGVMRGRLVLRGGLRGPVGFDQKEPRRIILLLEHIEPGQPGIRMLCRAFSKDAAQKASAHSGLT